MSDLTFKITRLFAGTEKQKNVGIHAKFNMDILNADGIIATVKDLMLRQSREGKYYIESPFSTYSGKDKEGNPKEQKSNYIKFFPEEKNWSKNDAIVQMVLTELNSPKKPQSYSNNKQSNHSAPQRAAPAAPSKQSNDIW